jgi:hypothetical protein
MYTALLLVSLLLAQCILGSSSKIACLKYSVRRWTGARRSSAIGG